MKKKTIIIIVIVAVILVTIGIVLYRKKNKASSPGSDTNFPLQVGTTGAAVKSLQTALNTLTPITESKMNVDGIFGPITHDAVMMFLGLNKVQKSQYDKLMEITKGKTYISLTPTQMNQIQNA